MPGVAGSILAALAVGTLTGVYPAVLTARIPPPRRSAPTEATHVSISYNGLRVTRGV